MKLKQIFLLLGITTIILLMFITINLSTPTKENIIIEEQVTSVSKKTNKKITFKDFKKMFKEEKLYTIAITDKNSNTHDIFIKLINTMSTKNHTNIYILDIGKMSKKELAKFYNLNSRFKELDSNYVIKTYKSIILEESTFDLNHLNILVDNIKGEK